MNDKELTIIGMNPPKAVRHCNKHKSSDPDCWKCQKKVFAAKAKEMSKIPSPRRGK